MALEEIGNNLRGEGVGQRLGEAAFNVLTGRLLPHLLSGTSVGVVDMS